MFDAFKGLFGASRYKLTTVSKIDRFVCGQVWSYKTRHHEGKSRLTLIRIDKDSKGVPIFHVAIDQLKLKNPNSPEGLTHDLPHTPLSQAGMDCSVHKLQKTLADVPNRNEGYDVWLAAWQQGKANIYAIPIKELIDFVERSLCANEAD